MSYDLTSMFFCEVCEKYFKTKAPLKTRKKKYHEQDIFRKGTSKTVSGDCSLSPNYKIPSLPNTPNSAHNTLVLFPKITQSVAFPPLCDGTKFFDRDRDQGRDQKYDGTGTGTKAGTRNMTGLGPGPRPGPEI